MIDRRFRAAAAVTLLVATACNSSGPPQKELDPEIIKKLPLSEFDVVDCIFPGTVMQMGGNMTYQTPRRMARAARFECEAQGGNFKLFDPTDPQATIQRLEAEANTGDLDAQNRLGLVYEGALGTPPDYDKAARWYRSAAEKGHSQAQFNLGSLYEKGLGVELNVLEALQWYRKASGLTDDSLMLSSQSQAQIEQLRTSLNAEIEDLKKQREALATQVRELERNHDARANEQISALKKIAASLEVQSQQTQTKLAGLPTTRNVPEPESGAVAQLQFPEVSPMLFDGLDVGRYYALVVGVTHYKNLPPLMTPEYDAEEIGELLKSKYGFSVQTLLDPDYDGLERAILAVSRKAGPNDNVLIYFAGHGQLKSTPTSGLLGYWLPVNADADAEIYWVNNQWVTDQIGLSPSKRILIIADSCYGGLFSSDPSLPPLRSMPPENQAELQRKLTLRSRLVLSSGDDQPVVDSVGENHSVFARAFIEVLQDNDGVLRIQELYSRVVLKLDRRQRELGLSQVPQLRPIRAADHVAPNFILIAGRS